MKPAEENQIAIDGIAPETLLEVNSENLSCDISGEVIILDLRSGMYFGLNAVGARVWALLAQPRSFEELRQTILDEFEVELDRCEQDLKRLIQQMAERGLVRLRK